MTDQTVTGWNGIYAACFTPLREDETLDAGGFERFLNALLDQGVGGLYITGSTGEGFALDDHVRVSAFQVAARICSAHGARSLAHVGAVPTRRAVALARQAAECGCDGIAAVPPTGGRFSYEELTGYYTALAQATPLPLFVYHIPILSGYDFSREQLSRWLEIPNVRGIKFTDNNLHKLERLVAHHPDKAIFFGSDGVLMHGLNCGAVGAIGSTYNLVGPLALKIAAAVRRGDQAAARKGQAALNAFIEAKNTHGDRRPVKTLLARRFGWETPNSPHPAQSGASDAECAAVEKALNEALAVAQTLP